MSPRLTVVYAPYHRTGGVEALHQLAEALPGAEVRYWPPLFTYLAAPYPPAGTRVVVPEIWPDLATALHEQGCEVYFWHLGVRATFPVVPDGVKHLACGEYVMQQCVRMGVQAQMLTDYIDPVFSPPPSSARIGARDLVGVYGARTDAFIYIYDMHHPPKPLPPLHVLDGRYARKDVVDRLCRARIYVDCQENGMPGRDRMPREAALCGCIPVVCNEGAASAGDVPYLQTWPREQMPEAIERALRGDYDSIALASYVEWIKGAEARFREEVRAVFGRRTTIVIPTLTATGAMRATNLGGQVLATSAARVCFIDNGGYVAALIAGDDSIRGAVLIENARERGLDVYTPGKNLGVAASWNEAIRRYSNDWLIFANDDVTLAPNSVSRLVAAAEETDAVLVGCELEYGYPFFLLKPEAHRTIGFFDEQFFPAYGEDNDYTYRLKLAGLKKVQVECGVDEPASGTTVREIGVDREMLKHRQGIRYVAKWGGPPGAESLREPRFAELVPEVFIATVPWRRAILEEMLRTIAQDPPRCVHLYLDAYNGEPTPAIPAGLNVEIVRNDGPPKGPGPRWYGAAAAPDDVLAITIDDDMKIVPDYLVRTVAAWTRLKEPFSWGGGGLSWGMPGHYTRESVEDMRLFCMGAGTAAVPAKYLRGIEDDPDAADFLGYMGHDEVFISWWLREHRLWRPAGPPVAADTVGTHDPRSQWAYRDRLLPFEQRMRARGWETPPGAPKRAVPEYVSHSGPFAWKAKRWQK